MLGEERNEALADGACGTEYADVDLAAFEHVCGDEGRWGLRMARVRRVRGRYNDQIRPPSHDAP